jgi:hypothetical protein
MRYDNATTNSLNAQFTFERETGNSKYGGECRKKETTGDNPHHDYNYFLVPPHCYCKDKYVHQLGYKSAIPDRACGEITLATAYKDITKWYVFCNYGDICMEQALGSKVG